MSPPRRAVATSCPAPEGESTPGEPVAVGDTPESSRRGETGGFEPGGRSDADLQAITAFLDQIGLGVVFETIEGETFLPGIRVHAGTLRVDRARLLAAGDLLHEAGHLAVMTPPMRAVAEQDMAATPAEEMMAIAWSYAACRRIGRPAEVVFHDQGYRGGSQALVDNFEAGRYIGVPTLAWIGMTDDPARPEPVTGCAYPAMAHWLRPS